MKTFATRLHQTAKREGYRDKTEFTSSKPGKSDFQTDF